MAFLLFNFKDGCSMLSGMISIENLNKSYGNFAAVKNLNLKIGNGEVFGFLGPNGAGKTTTIRMLMGILVPTSGRAVIEGMDCQKQSAEVKHKIGYLPDNPIFYDYLKGREILEFVGEMQGLTRASARNRTAELLYLFQLQEAAEEFAINYSTGMRKKLGLAMALVHQPPVLILDEPTNGLDPRAAVEVKDFLTQAAGRGTTIFLSTHLLDMAQKLCHRVGIIDHGKLVAVGRWEELRETLMPGGSLEDLYFKVTASASDPGEKTR
jgi:ABC-2 type transport system ATP-binding protein